MENNLIGQEAELSFTVTITRKATGAVETYQMIGHSDADKLNELLKKDEDK